MIEIGPNLAVALKEIAILTGFFCFIAFLAWLFAKASR